MSKYIYITVPSALVLVLRWPVGQLRRPAQRILSSSVHRPDLRPQPARGTEPSYGWLHDQRQ